MRSLIIFVQICALASSQVLATLTISDGALVTCRDSVQDTPAKDLHFTPEFAASDRRPDGTVIAYNNYVSDDGVGVFLTIEKHLSVASAKKALSKRMRKATRIIERAAKVNREGQRVGERIVMLSSSGISKKTMSAVFWTDQNNVYGIESSSLKHALEFEKQNYH